MGVKRLDVRTKKTLQDSIGIEKVTFEETVTELPLPRREKQLLELLKEVAALQREVDEDVRFNEKAVSLLGVGRVWVSGRYGMWPRRGWPSRWAGFGRAAEAPCGSP